MNRRSCVQDASFFSARAWPWQAAAPVFALQLHRASTGNTCPSAAGELIRSLREQLREKAEPPKRSSKLAATLCSTRREHGGRRLHSGTPVETLHRSA